MRRGSRPIPHSPLSFSIPPRVSHLSSLSPCGGGDTDPQVLAAFSLPSRCRSIVHQRREIREAFVHSSAQSSQICAGPSRPPSAPLGAIAIRGAGFARVWFI
ncbi:hypothetical protein PVAP13_4KG001781 [Panicum virgatum]|uniref:Uncharacterized protein n=1 Tax=Panicum virgatum TaxID=38727 RepID=A0A8T0TDB8_PANVG|nr:hypothetical protein PVAP13_4KG001781 [Panicum virgatum]